MSAPELIAKLRVARQSWVELDPAKPHQRVQIIRPPESEIGNFADTVGRGLVANLGKVCQYVTGWEGFTEADLVGAAGSGDVVPFDAALWAEVVADRGDWLNLVAARLLDVIVTHVESKAKAAKN
jgi:hypothetical protein